MDGLVQKVDADLKPKGSIKTSQGTGLGFRVQGSGFRVLGFGFRV